MTQCDADHSHRTGIELRERLRSRRQLRLGTCCGTNGVANGYDQLLGAVDHIRAGIGISS